MIHVVLYEPEIPPNTGNIARLCAATKVDLHLIEPLGFSLEDRYLKRAGLDYWPYVSVSVWSSLDEYLQNAGKHQRLVASSSRKGVPYQRFTFGSDDSILLGPETRGLPIEVMEKIESSIRIPIWGKVRSLNLSTAAGILLYQALSSSGVLDSVE